MQVIKQNVGLFGRLGKNIGQGINEQLPKEVERARLASGLKRFEQESQNLTPLQQFTRAAAIPGITPEHLYTMAPLLRQQAMRDEINGLAGKGGKNIPGRQNQPGMQAQPGIEDLNQGIGADIPEGQGQAGALKPLSATQGQLTPIVQRSDAELLTEAAQLSQQYPNTYPTPQDALPLLRDRENTRIANLQEERAVGATANAIQDRLRSRFTETVGGEDTAKDIPGTVKAKFMRNIESELSDPRNKLSEQQIIDKWAKQGKAIAQAQTNLDAKSKGGWLAKAGAIGGVAGSAISTIAGDYLPKQIKRTIDTTRQVYHDAGADEEFQDIIAGKFDLSSAGSAYLTFPRENEAINKYASQIKIGKNDDPAKIAIKAADYASEHLKGTDSVLSYAMELKKKGIDPQIFFDRMIQNGKTGLFTPNPRQKNEFQKGYPTFPSLGDMYIFSLTKENKLAAPL